eukprot:g6450.t1
MERRLRNKTIVEEEEAEENAAEAVGGEAVMAVDGSGYVKKPAYGGRTMVGITYEDLKLVLAKHLTRPVGSLFLSFMEPADVEKVCGLEDYAKMPAQAKAAAAAKSGAPAKPAGFGGLASKATPKPKPKMSLLSKMRTTVTGKLMGPSAIKENDQAYILSFRIRDIVRGERKRHAPRAFERSMQQGSAIDIPKLGPTKIFGSPKAGGKRAKRLEDFDEYKSGELFYVAQMGAKFYDKPLALFAQTEHFWKFETTGDKVKHNRRDRELPTSGLVLRDAGSQVHEYHIDRKKLAKIKCQQAQQEQESVLQLPPSLDNPEIPRVDCEPMVLVAEKRVEDRTESEYESSSEEDSDDSTNNDPMKKLYKLPKKKKNYEAFLTERKPLTIPTFYVTYGVRDHFALEKEIEAAKRKPGIKEMMLHWLESRLAGKLHDPDDEASGYPSHAGPEGFAEWKLMKQIRRRCADMYFERKADIQLLEQINNSAKGLEISWMFLCQKEYLTRVWGWRTPRAVVEAREAAKRAEEEEKRRLEEEKARVAEEERKMAIIRGTAPAGSKAVASATTLPMPSASGSDATPRSDKYASTVGVQDILPGEETPQSTSDREVDSLIATLTHSLCYTTAERGEGTAAQAPQTNAEEGGSGNQNVGPVGEPSLRMSNLLAENVIRIGGVEEGGPGAAAGGGTVEPTPEQGAIAKPLLPFGSKPKAKPGGFGALLLNVGSVVEDEEAPDREFVNLSAREYPDKLTFFATHYIALTYQSEPMFPSMFLAFFLLHYSEFRKAEVDAWLGNFRVMPVKRPKPKVEVAKAKVVEIAVSGGFRACDGGPSSSSASGASDAGAGDDRLQAVSSPANKSAASSPKAGAGKSPKSPSGGGEKAGGAKSPRKDGGSSGTSSPNTGSRPMSREKSGSRPLSREKSGSKSGSSRPTSRGDGKAASGPPPGKKGVAEATGAAEQVEERKPPPEEGEEAEKKETSGPAGGGSSSASATGDEGAESATGDDGAGGGAVAKAKGKARAKGKSKAAGGKAAAAKSNGKAAAKGKAKAKAKATGAAEEETAAAAEGTTSGAASSKAGNSSATASAASGSRPGSPPRPGSSGTAGSGAGLEDGKHLFCAAEDAKSPSATKGGGEQGDHSPGSGSSKASSSPGGGANAKPKAKPSARRPTRRGTSDFVPSSTDPSSSDDSEDSDSDASARAPPPAFVRSSDSEDSEEERKKAAAKAKAKAGTAAAKKGAAGSKDKKQEKEEEVDYKTPEVSELEYSDTDGETDLYATTTFRKKKLTRDRLVWMAKLKHRDFFHKLAVMLNFSDVKWVLRELFKLYCGVSILVRNRGRKDVVADKFLDERSSWWKLLLRDIIEALWWSMDPKQARDFIEDERYLLCKPFFTLKLAQKCFEIVPGFRWPDNEWKREVLQMVTLRCARSSTHSQITASSMKLCGRQGGKAMASWLLKALWGLPGVLSHKRPPPPKPREDPARAIAAATEVGGAGAVGPDGGNPTSISAPGAPAAESAPAGASTAQPEEKKDKMAVELCFPDEWKSECEEIAIAIMQPQSQHWQLQEMYNYSATSPRHPAMDFLQKAGLGVAGAAGAAAGGAAASGPALPLPLRPAGEAGAPATPSAAPSGALVPGPIPESAYDNVKVYYIPPGREYDDVPWYLASEGVKKKKAGNQDEVKKELDRQKQKEENRLKRIAYWEDKKNKELEQKAAYREKMKKVAELQYVEYKWKEMKKTMPKENPYDTALVKYQQQLPLHMELEELKAIPIRGLKKGEISPMREAILKEALKGGGKK